MLVRTTTAGTVTVPVGFLDGYSPPGVILYWRFDGTMTGAGTAAVPVGYTYSDNWPSGVPDPQDAMYQFKNFTTQARFNEVAVSATISGTGASAKVRWQTTTFILASPGHDGHYGYTKMNKTTGDILACSASDKEDATYTAPMVLDDIINGD
jgi:hypothetical protein